MRVGSWLLALAVVALLACGPLPRYIPPAWRPDIFVILVVFAALRAEPGRDGDALALCWLTGLAKDLLSSGPVGQYALLYLAAGAADRAPAAGHGRALGGERRGAGVGGGVHDGMRRRVGGRARRRQAVADARRVPRRADRLAGHRVRRLAVLPLPGSPAAPAGPCEEHAGDLRRGRRCGMNRFRPRRHYGHNVHKHNRCLNSRCVVPVVPSWWESVRGVGHV